MEHRNRNLMDANLQEWDVFIPRGGEGLRFFKPSCVIWLELLTLSCAYWMGHPFHVILSNVASGARRSWLLFRCHTNVYKNKLHLKQYRLFVSYFTTLSQLRNYADERRDVMNESKGMWHTVQVSSSGQASMGTWASSLEFFPLFL